MTAWAAEAGTDRPMKIIFLGDSITGWSDPSKWLKYSHIVECMLDARSGPGGHVVLNRGIGGDTTANLLARLDQDVLSENPDVVVLLTGGNDGGDQETRAANIDHLVTRISAACPRILLMQYHLLMVPDTAQSAWVRTDDGFADVAATAAKHGLPLLDMAQAFDQVADNTVPADEKDFRKLTTWHGLNRFRTCDLVGVDGIHLNGGGEIVYARATFAKLLELGWLTRD